MAYYRFICPYGLSKFKRFAVNVWGVVSEGKTDEAVAEEGLLAMENWMKELGLAMNITDLGVTEEMLPGIVKATFLLDGGYKVLTADDVMQILKASM
jgi:alcohol dehydrogenase YqhD (iron-dependent ADH family)